MSLAVVLQLGPFIPAVRLLGELDYDYVDDFEEALDHCLAGGADTVLVDCSELSFCDSTGLSAFLRAHRLLTDRGGGLHLAGPPDTLRRILKVTGLDQVLLLHPSLPAAESRLGPRRGDVPQPSPEAGARTQREGGRDHAVSDSG